MKRQIFENLLYWKRSLSRKPLILQGARQVGKTYILKAFAALEYENVAYLNFETSPHLHELFSGSLKPADILKVLSIELSAPIIPEKTLIIFDEVQECPDALNSLKYFNESANEYHICAAGSLLGVALANSKGFPVGKVDFLHLYPLCFNEFLQAKDEEALLEFIEQMQMTASLPLILHEKLLSLFKEYLYIGGMPEVVREYINTNDFERVRATQKSILQSYRLDFSKHAPPNVIMKINQVWDVIPSQLAKENKKFIYSVIRKGARAQEFEVAIQWLCEAGLFHKVHNASIPKLPLTAYINHEIFKIYLVDVGLLGAMAGLSTKAIIYGNNIFQEFQGSIAENYVAQELVKQEYGLFYWTSEGRAEIDFIIEDDDIIYPIEVKSGLSSKKKSLLVYANKYHPKIQVRISPMNLKMQEEEDRKFFNCPIYLVGNLKKLLYNT